MDAVVSALSDYPEFVPEVARWHWREWGHTDPAGTLRSWTAGLARQAGADQIPGTLVAVAQGAPVGAVCLVEHDMPGHEAVAGMSPWIKGLYVDQPARRRGYGALLMSRCETWPLPWDATLCTCTPSVAPERSSFTAALDGKSSVTSSTTAWT
jgi:GNAT superfamily N-acetyltransferase